MKLDETTTQILQEVKEELYEEDGIELGIDEIFGVVNSQFVGAAFAVQKRISWFFCYLGTFVLKNKKAYVESVKEVEKLKGVVSEEEYKKIVRQKKIANKNVMNGASLKTIKELQELPETIAERKTLKHFNELYKEILQNG